MDLTKKKWQWAMLLFLAFIWGTSFILMKKGLQSYTNSQVASFRILFTFIFFIPVFIPRIKKINKGNIKSLLIVGVIGNTIPAFLFTKAQTHIDSSLAGVLNSLTPLFTLLIGLILYKNHVKIINILGLILGFFGAVGLIYKGNPGGFEPQTGWYSSLILIATFCYGISVNEIKNKLHDLDGLSIASLSFMFVGPFAGINLLFSDLSGAFSQPHALANLGYIVLLSLFSSVVAVVLFNILIKYTTAIYAASVTYIIPIFAIFWGVFDGEKVSFQEILWMLVILIGVYLVNKKKLVKI
ncbi:MAG: DMT family transporter [Bacteroidales bacterium]|nr:DMT family transporter [Bacteroidales bacterium]